jgi:hypothetical protein
MYGKHQWKGREVEGRYSDLMTFFVRDLNHNMKSTYGLEVKILMNILIIILQLNS